MLIICTYTLCCIKRTSWSHCFIGGLIHTFWYTLTSLTVFLLGCLSFLSAHHFPLVAEAESTDVLWLSWLVRSSAGGGVNVEERRWRGVARLSVVKRLAQKQNVPQMTDVAAGQTKSLDLRKLPNHEVTVRFVVLIRRNIKCYLMKLNMHWDDIIALKCSDMTNIIWLIEYFIPINIWIGYFLDIYSMIHEWKKI